MNEQHPTEPDAADRKEQGDRLLKLPDEFLVTLEHELLVSLLYISQDRTPRNVIDECVRRGDSMVEQMITVLQTESYWSDDASYGAKWSLIHAVHVLGLNDSEAAGHGLIDAMLSGAACHAEHFHEWTAPAWPALFRNKPATVFARLEQLVREEEVTSFAQVSALEVLIARALRDTPPAVEALLDQAAALIAARLDEDENFCIMLGSLLLHFPRPRHRALLERLVESTDLIDRESLEAAYEEATDQPPWEPYGDPWQFYDPDEIAARQKQWAEQDAADLLSSAPIEPYIRDAPKVGRNDPCPCGSGKKYKKCCLDAQR